MEVEPAKPVAVPVALGDLRVAVEVHAGRPECRLVDQGAQHEIATVRAAVDREAPIRPRLGGCPAARVDQVVDVRVAPLVDVADAEGAPVAGRTAEVDVEDGEALGDEELLEWEESAE